MVRGMLDRNPGPGPRRGRRSPKGGRIAPGTQLVGFVKVHALFGTVRMVVVQQAVDQGVRRAEKPHHREKSKY